MNHAYAAGIIDGEGSVMIIQRRTPTISVTNSSKPIIDYLHNYYGGLVKVQTKYKEHHKQCWIWTLRGDKVITFLRQVVPHMLETNKVERSKIIINEWKNKTPRNGKYSSQQLIEKNEMIDRFLAWG